VFAYAFPCVHAAATTPVQRLGVLFAHSPGRISLPRKGSVGSGPAHRPFSRPLLGVHSRCGLPHSRGSPMRDPLSEGLQPISFTLHDCSGLPSGWSGLPGWALHPLESAALSRRTPKAVHSDVRVIGCKWVTQWVPMNGQFRRRPSFGPQGTRVISESGPERFPVERRHFTGRPCGEVEG